MKLENVFGTPEKIEPEKKLEVIASDESVIDELLAYFEKHIPMLDGSVSENADLFNRYMSDLSSFQKISPKVITKINAKLPKKSPKLNSKHLSSYRGIYLSVLIQKSYEQGFNKFEFNRIDANLFGAFLKGSEENKIKLKVGEIDCDSFPFFNIENCLIEVKKGFVLHGVYHPEDSIIYSPDETLITRLGGNIEWSTTEFVHGKMPKEKWD